VLVVQARLAGGERRRLFFRTVMILIGSVFAAAAAAAAVFTGRRYVPRTGAVSSVVAAPLTTLRSAGTR